MFKDKKWFTLVELIVVVVILSILSVIWFVSYSSYITWVRDANRISSLHSIIDWLKVYSLKKTIPLPENKIEIKNWSEVISYQWEVWEKILESIDYSSEWIDPKDKNFYTYYLTKDRNWYQLMGLLEEPYLKTAFIKLWEEANADYTNRYPYVVWLKLWILTDETNTPIEDISTIQTAWELDISDVTTDTYKLYLKNDDVLIWSWTDFAQIPDILYDKWRGWSVENNVLSYTDLDWWNTTFIDCSNNSVWTIVNYGWSDYYVASDRVDLINNMSFYWGSYNAKNICTSHVTDMSELFEYWTFWIAPLDTFNEDISMWDVSNVTNMREMFLKQRTFNQNITNWDVSSVEIFRTMFMDTDSFNQDIADWNISSITSDSSLEYMFRNAVNFNSDLSKWCVINVASLPTWFDSWASSWSSNRPVWWTCQ